MCPDVSLQSLWLHYLVVSESSKADLAAQMSWAVTLSGYSIHPTPVQATGQPESPLVYFRRFLMGKSHSSSKRSLSGSHVDPFLPTFSPVVHL